ncbi:MAG: hypothetical protein WD424_09170 [Paenibacillaceae bacterium]
MDKLRYLSRISLFETLPKEDLLEIDRMTPMTHFNALPKGTMVQTPDTYRGIDSFSLGTNGIYIETMGETLICSVLKEHFESFLSKRPQLAMKFLKELSDQLKN